MDNRMKKKIILIFLLLMFCSTTLWSGGITDKLKQVIARKNVAAVTALYSSQSPCDSPCTIPPGAKKVFCKRYGQWMYRRWVELCKTRPDYRKAWEEGRGPGQQWVARSIRTRSRCRMRREVPQWCSSPTPDRNPRCGCWRCSRSQCPCP